MSDEIPPMPDDVRAFLSEAGTYDEPVSAAELCNWIGGDVSQVGRWCVTAFLSPTRRVCSR
jgi:hypothetical protein